jgi:hypothetical protein
MPIVAQDIHVRCARASNPPLLVHAYVFRLSAVFADRMSEHVLSDIVKRRSIRMSLVVMSRAAITSRRCLTARLRVDLETSWSFCHCPF